MLIVIGLAAEPSTVAARDGSLLHRRAGRTRTVRLSRSPTSLPITTPADVRAWLVAFFLELPGAPVYATASGEARFLDPDKSPSSFDWPRFTAEALGSRSRAAYGF